MSYDFNMASLADHLKKQSEQGSSTYYNIDIIKYEVRRAKSKRQHGQVLRALDLKSGDSKFKSCSYHDQDLVQLLSSTSI